MKHLAAIIVVLTLANAAQAQLLDRLVLGDESPRTQIGNQATLGGMTGPFMPLRNKKMVTIKKNRAPVNVTIIMQPVVTNQQMKIRRRRGPLLALFSRR